MGLAERIQKLIEEEQAELADKVNSILDDLNYYHGAGLDYDIYSHLFDAVSGLVRLSDIRKKIESGWEKAL